MADKSVQTLKVPACYLGHQLQLQTSHYMINKYPAVYVYDHLGFLRFQMKTI